MAIAIDASTPAAFGAVNATSITSASFTAPVGSRILLGVGVDDNTVAHTQSVTDTGSLTWTRVAHNTGLFADMWISSVIASATARTVTAATTFSSLLWAKPWVLTGVDATTPTGATGTNSGGANTTNSATVNGYTSTVDNSLGFLIAMDDSANGVPTSSDTGTGASVGGGESWLAVSKAAATTPSGTVVTFNLDAFGAGAATWWWSAVEVLPASGAATAPAQVTGLSAFNAGSTSVNLAWTTPSDGGSAITDYLVEQAPDASGVPGSWTTFTHGASTTPSITVTGLTTGTLYWFRVSAVNAIGTGTASATATATPAAPPSMTPAAANTRTVVRSAMGLR